MSKYSSNDSIPYVIDLPIYSPENEGTSLRADYLGFYLIPRTVTNPQWSETCHCRVWLPRHLHVNVYMGLPGTCIWMNHYLLWGDHSFFSCVLFFKCEIFHVIFHWFKIIVLFFNAMLFVGYYFAAHLLPCSWHPCKIQIKLPNSLSLNCLVLNKKHYPKQIKLPIC